MVASDLQPLPPFDHMLRPTPRSMEILEGNPGQEGKESSGQYIFYGGYCVSNAALTGPQEVPGWLARQSWTQTHPGPWDQEESGEGTWEALQRGEIERGVIETGANRMSRNLPGKRGGFWEEATARAKSLGQDSELQGGPCG